VKEYTMEYINCELVLFFETFKRLCDNHQIIAH